MSFLHLSLHQPSGFNSQNPANGEQEEGEPLKNDSIPVNGGRGAWCEGEGHADITPPISAAANDHVGTRGSQCDVRSAQECLMSSPGEQVEGEFIKGERKQTRCSAACEEQQEASSRL